MTGGPTSRVVLYSRPGCHLCDDARAELEQLRARLPFDLREVSIEGDAELERRFTLEIPVIEVDGVVVTLAPIDLSAVERAITAPAAGRRSQRRVSG